MITLAFYFRLNDNILAASKLTFSFYYKLMVFYQTYSKRG